jgi:hypothetical protein
MQNSKYGIRENMYGLFEYVFSPFLFINKLCTTAKRLTLNWKLPRLDSEADYPVKVLFIV